MSIDGMREAWGSFSGRIQEFYEIANSPLLENEPFEAAQFEELEPLIEAMLVDSERIRHDAERTLQTEIEEYETAANLLLAVASVDAMLASDLAMLDPEAGGDRRGELVEAREETAYELDQEREQTRNRVDRLFSGEEPVSAGGGALADDRRQLIQTAFETTTALVDAAKTPAPELLRGLTTAASGGLAEVLAAAQHVDMLADLKGSAAGMVNQAPRFLREHAAKMLALRPDVKILGDVAERLRRALDVDALLAWISAYDEANRRNEKVIWAAPDDGFAAPEALEAELRALLPGYQQQMSLIGTSAKWLRRGASPLTHLVAPLIGHAAICGVFLIGIGYVAYSLTDRIDARNLGFADRIDGVVKLVAKRALPEAEGGPSEPTTG